MSGAIRAARVWEGWSAKLHRAWSLVGVKGKGKGEGNGQKKGRIEIKRKDGRKGRKEGRQEGRKRRWEGGREGGARKAKEEKGPGVWGTKWTFQSGSCTHDSWTWWPAIPSLQSSNGVRCMEHCCLLTFPSTWCRLEDEGHAISFFIPPQCLPCWRVSTDLGENNSG